MARKTRKHHKKGGTRSILKKYNNNKNKTEKTAKKVQWAESVISPKRKLGRTRSRTKSQNK